MFVPPAMAPKLWDALLQAGRATGSSRAASVRATRCASRRRCALRQRHRRRRRPCSKPIWAGSSAGRRRRSSATTCCARRRRGRERKIVGFAMIDRAIARTVHPVMQGDEGRRRDQRHADAVSEEGDRDGYVPAAHDRAGHRARDRHPRPPRQGHRRADCRSTSAKNRSRRSSGKAQAPEMPCIRPI